MNSNKDPDKKFVLPGVRYIFAITGFLGFCTIYAIRVNINVAIVAMINSTVVYNQDNKTSSDECTDSSLPIYTNSTTPSQKTGEFLWSPKMQGVILGAFYYGYCISQIPGGRLAEIFSGKWVFGIGVGITALLTLITPLAAQYHVGLLITIRALEGLAQGVTMPAMHAMLGRWAPDSEKGILNCLIYSGINIGTVAAMPLTGYLCNTDFLGGWPSAFYIIGIFGCLWCILWFTLVTDTPLTHPFISKRELKYITTNQKIELKSELNPIPWMKVWTSIPFWALIVTSVGQDWCFYTIINDLPTFFATILHFKMEQTGFLSSFPYLMQTFVGMSTAFIADTLIRKEMVTTNFVRKFCNSVASFGTSLGLIGVCLSACNVTMNVSFFIFSLAIGGFCYSGYMLTHLDLSPEYAGTLMGITNTISNLAGFIAPLLVGFLTDNQQTLHQWRIVFGITAIILSLSGVVYIFFSSSKKQNWGRAESSESLIYTGLSTTQTNQHENEYGAINS
ncbi:hypothetical protein JTE90_021721 [Oedothorax gibbosus]|uniref:Sialin n=1 Tax=Oedothorax gibbosus TaxID=931172 RepID=A0AAV6UFT0_9ARAC|nr:hypothetical protein JTE90_021721 [Oedothorax gibbosus]